MTRFHNEFPIYYNGRQQNKIKQKFNWLFVGTSIKPSRPKTHLFVLLSGGKHELNFRRSLNFKC